jgi:hypothetical protein
MKLKTPFLLVICLVPYILFILFNIFDRALPSTDGANYLTNAFQYKNIFYNDGIKAGIRSLYFVRDWKPTIYPVILFIFTLLPDGGIELYTSIIQLTFLFFVNLGAYSLIRNFCSRRIAALSSSGLVISQMIFNWANTLFAETFTFGLILFWLSHLVKVESFTNKKHTIISSITCSLILMTRPGELIIPITLIYLIVIFRIKIKFRNFATLTTLFVLSFTQIYLEVFYSKWALNPVLFLFLVLILSIFGTIGNNNHLILALSLIIILTNLWYLFFWKSLYLWIYETSFGEMTKYWNPGSNNAYSNILLIVSQIEAQLLIIFICWLLYFSLKLIDLKRSRQSEKSIESKPNLDTLVFSVCLLTVLPLISVLYTTAVDVRRIFFGLSLLTLLSYMTIIRYNIRIAISIYLFNLIIIINSLFVPNYKFLSLSNSYSSFDKFPSQESSFILELKQSGLPQAITIGTYIVDSTNLNVHRLNLVSTYNRTDYRFSYFWKYDTFNQNLEDLRIYNKASYLLLDLSYEKNYIADWDLYGKLSKRFNDDFSIYLDNEDSRFLKIKDFYFENTTYSLFLLK